MAPPAEPASTDRGFQRLLRGVWVSNLGDGVRNAALPLLAVSLADEASGVTAVAAAGTVPFALFGLVAGTTVDRRSRRTLIVAAHLVRAVVIGVLALTIATDTVTLTIAAVASFALGCGEAVADSATPALVPVLVADGDLEDANASLETAELLANDLIGPPIGSGLFGIAAAVPFAVDALSFVGAAAVVARLDDAEVDGDLTPTTTWRADFVEGARTVWTNRVLRTTGALVVGLQVGHLAALAPFVVFLTEELGLGAGAYGLFLSAGAVGGVAGARTAPRAIARFGARRTMTAVLVTSVAAFLSMAVPTVVTAGIGFTVSFGAVVIGRIIIFSARQRSVDRRLMGRAQGAMRSMIWSAATAGALIGGILYDRVSPSAPAVFAAAVYAAASVLSRAGMRPMFLTDEPPTTA